MKGRCCNPNDSSYKNYGGRGITYTPNWESYEAFLADMGRAPGPEYSLDRIDVDGNYEASNCRWVTWDVQLKNQRRTRWIEYNGERKCLTDWANEYNIKPKTLSRRLGLGWDIHEALVKPVANSDSCHKKAKPIN